jgi:hypothetical protein
MRLLVVACLAIGAQTIIGLKSPVARYLLPALVATAFVNPVLYLILRKSAFISPAVRQLCPVVTAMLILVGLGRNGLYFEWWIDATRVDQQNISAVRDVENTLPGCQLISSYRSSLQSYAISFGSNYSGNVHSPILTKLYPGTIFYSPFTRKFRSFARILNSDNIRRMIFDGQCVVVEGGSLNGDIARQTPFHSDDVRFTPLITTANPILPASATFLYRLDPAGR